MIVSPHVTISPDAIPRPVARQQMERALADLLRSAPDGPWSLEIDPSPSGTAAWTLYMGGFRRSVIQTVLPGHQDLAEVLRVVADALHLDALSFGE
jgi:hypothetical protein